MDVVKQELANFERIVPYADEATMVLKAHLILEQSLWKFIAQRVPDEKLVAELRGEHSGIASGKALVQLARAVAARDDVPISNGETLWPMLLKLNQLRNRLVHDLEPSRESVERPMRQIIAGVLGESSIEKLNPAFYGATQLLLAYLAIDRVPSTIEDCE